MYARPAFGAAAILAGAVALLPQTPGPWHRVLGFILILGGLAMLHPRTERCGAIATGAVYGYFSLATIPGMVHAPAAYVSYGAFFESFAVVCGALAVFLLRPARTGFGLCALSFAVAQVVYPKFTASLVPAWLPPGAVFWVYLTTVAFAAAGVALLADRAARRAAQLTALMLALFAVLVWVPRLVAQPADVGNWSECAETLLIAAAAWVISAAPRLRLGVTKL